MKYSPDLGGTREAITWSYPTFLTILDIYVRRSIRLYYLFFCNIMFFMWDFNPNVGNSKKCEMLWYSEAFSEKTFYSKSSGIAFEIWFWSGSITHHFFDCYVSGHTWRVLRHTRPHVWQHICPSRASLHCFFKNASKLLNCVTFGERAFSIWVEKPHLWL